MNRFTWISRTWVELGSHLWSLEARRKGVQLGDDCRFLGRPIISLHPGSSLRIGAGVRCFSAQRANLMACFQPCVLRTFAPGARLTLGRDVGLSAAVIISALSVEIGDGTQIGSGAVIVDNDFHSRNEAGIWGELDPSEARPVRLGARVFVGARAFILKGVTVGNDAVIGAGAVVTKNVPAGHLAAGNPARIQPLPGRP